LLAKDVKDVLLVAALLAKDVLLVAALLVKDVVDVVNAVVVVLLVDVVVGFFFLKTLGKLPEYGRKFFDWSTNY
jgi:hypothetical protein